jgi:hypothetical protein
MTVETHAIILDQGEEVIHGLYEGMEKGELMTKLTQASFMHIAIKNLKFVRVADPHETGGHGGNSIWVEVTISF